MMIAGAVGTMLAAKALAYIASGGGDVRNAHFVHAAVLVTAASVVMLVPAYLNAVLNIANGLPVTIGTFFRPRRVGEIVALGLIIGALSTVGALVFLVGSLAVSLFTVFAVIALLDGELTPVEAIRASLHVVQTNMVTALWTWLVMGGLFFAGSLFFGIGLLVTAPVALLFAFYVVRALLDIAEPMQF
ncbi:hypothetical protein [Mycolicibacter minnesotensis]